MSADTGIETRVYLGVAAAACGGALAGLPSPSLPLQAGLLAFAVLVFGLPHGALDPLVARRAGLIVGWRSAALFHLAYGAAGLAALGLWLVAPGLALVCFLAYSAHHFAGDWLKTGAAARLVLGAAVLGLPSVLHADEVAQIYSLLSGPAGAELASLQQALAPLWFATLASAVLIQSLSRRLDHALELAILVVTSLVLPPLVFFTLYFCVLHSPRHFLRHWRRSRDKAQVARAAVVYSSLAAVIAAGVAVVVAPATVRLEAAALQTVFIALAALTVPHLLTSSLAQHADASKRVKSATWD